MITDHLAAEALIIARLKDRVSVPHVLSVAELAGVLEEKQLTPAVQVIYAGTTPQGGDPDGAHRIAAQSWLTVVAVRNARQTGRSGTAIREQAGPIITQVLEALSGYRLGAGLRELRWMPGPAPAYSGVFGYFPLRFECEFLIKGA